MVLHKLIAEIDVNNFRQRAIQIGEILYVFAILQGDTFAAKSPGYHRLVWIQVLAHLVDFTAVAHSEDTQLILPRHFCQESGQSWALIQFDANAETVFLVDQSAFEIHDKDLRVWYSWQSVRQHLGHRRLRENFLQVVYAPVHKSRGAQEQLIGVVFILGRLILLDECHMVEEDGEACPDRVLDRLAYHEGDAPVPLKLLRVLEFFK